MLALRSVWNKIKPLTIHHRKLTVASATVNDKYVVIKSPKSSMEQEILKYPFVWLRDNCQCSSCFHKESLSRVVDWRTFDVDVMPIKVDFDCSEELRIRWSDDHSSVHGIQWLKLRKFCNEEQKIYLNTSFRPGKQYWNSATFYMACQKFNFEDCVNTDEGLRKWLHALSVNGVALIEGTPHDKTACRRLAERVGFIRRTHYGEDFVVANENGAPTQNEPSFCKTLHMHTDMPYYEYKPGVNLLHCLVQTRSDGGFNPLTDGLWIVKHMREHYPEELNVLTSTLVDWVDVGSMDGNQFHSRYRAPVICLDRDGEMVRVNHSTPQRDSHFTVPLEQVEPWYRASAVFVRLIHEGAVNLKTNPGEMLTFDNTRLIHGRTSYTDVQDNIRELVGAHLDWDEVFSRLRVLTNTE